MPATRKTINLIKPPRRSSDFFENLKVVLGIHPPRPIVPLKSYDPSVKYGDSGPSRSSTFLEDLKIVLGIGQPPLPEPTPPPNPEFTYNELSPSPSAEFMENLKVVQEAEEPAAAEPGSTEDEDLEVPFGVLTSGGGSSFLENLKAALGIGGQDLPELTSTPDPDVRYREVSPTRPAGRGLLYSILLHEIAIFALLIIPPTLRPERKFYYVEEWRPLITKLTYSLPAIGGGHSGGGQKGGGGKPGGGSTGNSASAPRPLAARADWFIPARKRSSQIRRIPPTASRRFSSPSLSSRRRSRRLCPCPTW